MIKLSIVVEIEISGHSFVMSEVEYSSGGRVGPHFLLWCVAEKRHGGLEQWSHLEVLFELSTL